MIILHPDGTLDRLPANQRANSRVRDAIELPAELAMQSVWLFDQVFAFAFDVLGLVSIELRIRPVDTTTADQGVYDGRI